MKVIIVGHCDKGTILEAINEFADVIDATDEAQRNEIMLGYQLMFNKKYDELLQTSRLIGLMNHRPIPRKINQRKLRKRIRQGCVVRQ